MGVSEFDALSKSYGLSTALLIFAVIGLLACIRGLYAKNELLHTRLEELTDRRSKALERLVSQLTEHHPDNPDA